MKNIIVVGAGLGGLATANLLAQKGHRVTVIEKNRELGGRARTWKKDGFTFDMGPSWYLMPEAFERYFALFGKKTSDYFRLKKLDPYYRVFFEKHDPVTITGDIEKTRKLFGSFEPGGADALKRYLDAAQYKYDVAMQDFLYRDYNSIFQFFNWRMMTEGLKLNIFTHLDKFVRRYFSDTRARQILEYAMVFLGNSPYNAPGLYSIMSHVDLNLGVFYPEGGMGRLPEALVKLGRSLGVEYDTSTEVKEIVTVDGRARIVKTSKGDYRADAVLVNADYAWAEENLLRPADRSYSTSYWKSRVYAPSMFLVYLGVSKRLKKLTHHNLYFSENWNDHFKTIFEKPSWPENPCFYVSCTSITDPTVAPAGTENVFLLVPIAPGLDDNEEQREKYCAMLLDHVEKVTGEKIKPYITLKRIFSVSDYRNDYNSWDGTSLGMAHTLFQSAVFRPARRSKKVKNLYYAGQYTHPGVGVPMVFIAAEVAAQRMLKDLS